MTERPRQIDRQPTEAQLTEILTVAKTAVQEAGGYLRSNPKDARMTMSYKSSRDPVLLADITAEGIIKARIKTAFFEPSILGEESGLEETDSPSLWVTDALDGSKNYLNGSPLYGVMLGVLIDKRPYVSTINLPELDRTVTAQKGKGALLNGQPTHVSTRENFTEAIINFGDFAKTDDGKGNKERLEDMARLADKVGRIRMVGSAAVDFISIATGMADGFVVRNPDPWDFMIGRLIVEEAGGKITEYETPSGKMYIVSNGKIHASLEAALLANRDATLLQAG